MPLTLSDAEQVAGVKSRGLRSDKSSIIDVCTFDTSMWSKKEKNGLRQKCAIEIGCSTLLFDPAWGVTIVGLSFTEAHLAQNLILYLQSHGLQPTFTLMVN
ncbi:hypothetical protein PENANT_c101G03386 [Penicillium antarcticum]|uniref:Uncharacterized protein n=1 Tax=Penicillium antarcticum TaxID=416450 RepID=A0A1V6PLU7_9EURO|nr:hypothetical protein PENANT_c101G03386 [Penicillium antarcticum]